MDFLHKRKPGISQPTSGTRPEALTPAQALQRKQAQHEAQRKADQERSIFEFAQQPVGLQRTAAGPVLLAASLQRQMEADWQSRRVALQRQLTDAPSVTPQAVEAALQRQEQRNSAGTPPMKPTSNADWVTVMRFQAQQAEGRTMSTRESGQFSALQRQVAQRLVQNFRQDRQAPQQRHEEYGGHLAALQEGNALSRQVAQVTLTQLPRGEQPAVQRAMQDALQREQQQRAADDALLKAHAVQRQLAELDAEATRPALNRIQERRGGGSPLPAGVQRHLELGLNHDLSGVRIHDDAEADKLAKNMNAVAFTTGNDIYFQSGKFDPTSRPGLELLAHEVTHTVQQAQGKVGAGVDPDSGLEAEARQSGEKLAAQPAPADTAATSPVLPSTAGHTGAVQRLKTSEPVPAKSPGKAAPEQTNKPAPTEEAKTQAPTVQAKAPEPAPAPAPVNHQDAPAPEVLPEAPAVEVQAAPDVELPSFDAEAQLAKVPDVPAVPEAKLPDLPEVKVSEPAPVTEAVPEPAAVETPTVQRAAMPGAARGITPAQARANARAAANAIAAAANAAAARVTSSANSSAAQITSQARSQGQGVLSAGRSQANAVRSAAQQSQNQIRQSAAKASSNIRNKAQSSTAKLAAQHAAGAAKAAQTINTNQQKVTQAANQHATQAVQSANQHASQATSKAQAAAAQVRGKAPGSSSIAPEVGQAKTSAGNQIATDATGKITPAGTQISSVTKQAGTQVSQGVHQKGTQITASIRAQGPRATQQLNTQRQGATQAITRGATQASTQLTTAAAQAGSKVASSAAQAQAKITQGATQQATQLQAGGAKAAAQVKQTAQATSRATQSAASRIRAMLAGSELTVADANRLKASAIASINRASGTLSSKAKGSSQKALSGLQKQASSLKSRLQQAGPKASSQLRQASAKVGSQLSSSVNKVTPGFNKVTQGHQQQAQKLNQQLGTKLSASVAKTSSVFQQGQGKLTSTLTSEVGKETQKLSQAGQQASANIASSHARADQKAQAEKNKIEAEAKAKEAEAQKDKSWLDKAKDKVASVWEGIKSWVAKQWDQMKAMFTSPGFIAGLVTGLVLGAAVLALTIATGGLALPMLIAIGAGVGAITAGVSTVVQNVADGKSWHEGLLKNMLIGGASGALLAALPAGAALAGGFTLTVGGGIAQNVMSGQPWDTNLLGNVLMGGAVPFAGKKLLGSPARAGSTGGTPKVTPLRNALNKVTTRAGNTKVGTAVRSTVNTKVLPKMYKFGDKFNRVTGNTGGRQKTYSGAKDDNIKIATKDGSIEVRHGPDAHKNDIRIHQNEAVKQRFDQSVPGKVKTTIEQAFGKKAPKPGTRKYELEVEARKHDQMAQWREKEAANPTTSKAEADKLRAEAHNLRARQKEYEQQAKTERPDTPGTNSIEREYPNLSAEELKAYRTRIDEAEAQASGLQGKAKEEALERAEQARYERYCANKEKVNETPSSREDWQVRADQARANKKFGGEREQYVLDQLGFKNNNVSEGEEGSYILRVKEGQKGTRPDALNDEIVVDVKSMTGKTKTLYDTEQMRLQRTGADGRQHAVVIDAPDGSYRPSGPLGKQSRVVMHNSKTGEWAKWVTDRSTGEDTWLPCTKNDALEFIKGK